MNFFLSLFFSGVLLTVAKVTIVLRKLASSEELDKPKEKSILFIHSQSQHYNVTVHN